MIMMAQRTRNGHNAFFCQLCPYGRANKFGASDFRASPKVEIIFQWRLCALILPVFARGLAHLFLCQTLDSNITQSQFFQIP